MTRLGILINNNNNNRANKKHYYHIYKYLREDLASLWILINNYIIVLEFTMKTTINNNEQPLYSPDLASVTFIFKIKCAVP